MKIFSMIADFFGMVIDFVSMIINSLLTLLQMLTTGIPAVIKATVNMPGFIVAGITVTISICICMVLLGRRSS